MSYKLIEQRNYDLKTLEKNLEKLVLINNPNLLNNKNPKEAKILNLACGNSLETKSLIDLVSKWKKIESDNIKLIGMDLRIKEIYEAKEISKKILPNSCIKNLDFLANDITNINTHKQISDDFDLVFLRHQNYWNDSYTWDKIYDQALSKINDTGNIIITSYFDEEHQLAIKSIERLGGKLIKSTRNIDSRELQIKGKSIDRNIAIFNK